MKRMLGLIVVLIVCQPSFAQDKKIDQLEIFYDQAYYPKVLRKSNKLLANPAYDYSGLPAYYRSLALFRMSDDERWFRRHKTSVENAIESYRDFSEFPSYDDYVHAHYYEISSLKSYLDKLGRHFKELGYNKDAELISDFSFEYFKGIKAKPDKHEILQNPELAGTGAGQKGQLDVMVSYAKTLIGIKYVWAGSDETGFDCSGFTGYVLKKYGLSIPRTASGQMDESKKLKVTNAQKGDLVFFGSGVKITHVGMVVSPKGGELAMIHASTSKGVIVTKIRSSSYWEPKLKGAGSYVED